MAKGSTIRCSECDHDQTSHDDFGCCKWITTPTGGASICTCSQPKG